MLNRFDYLKAFHNISPKDYEFLCKKLKTKAFGKGDHITVPGQTNRELYFIKSGVQMSYFETEKNIHVIAFTYPPNFCAIPESFLHQKPSQIYLTCLTDSEMDFISFDDLQELFDQSQQIERLFRKMIEAVLAGILNRHVELHSKTIEERYTAFCQRSPHLLQLVPHKYIASYLGIHPTNFSKLLNRVKF